MDANVEYEGSWIINPGYKKSGSYSNLTSTATGYNSTVDVMAISDIGFVTSDGLHYTCVRSAQINLNSTGVTYFDASRTSNITIRGYR